MKLSAWFFSILESFHHVKTYFNYREPILTTAPSLASLEYVEEPPKYFSKMPSLPSLRSTSRLHLGEIFRVLSSNLGSGGTL